MITVSSGRTTTQPLMSPPFAPFAACASAAGTWKPTARPPPTAADCFRNVLRDDANLTLSVPTLSLRRLLRAASGLRGRVDRLAHARVRAAATDVRQRLVDVLVRGIRVLLEQRRGDHHLAALAIAA